MHTVIHIPRSNPIWDFYFDISEWHILPARAWTPALMLHLTNTCAKRKVLSLTKPKGKMYKTKSLGHYITNILIIMIKIIIGSLGFWDTNKSPNVGQMTRPRDRKNNKKKTKNKNKTKTKTKQNKTKQNKKTLLNSGLCRPGRPPSKGKRKRKER